MSNPPALHAPDVVLSGTDAPAKRAAPSLEELYRRHARYVTRLAFLLTDDAALAEDLTQEAFLRLARSPDIPSEDAQLRAYLRTTVTRLSQSSYRSRRRRERREERATAGPVAAAGGESHTAVADAVMALPRRMRAAVALRYWDDLTDEQIAEILGCRPATVRSLLQRGRHRIKENLDG